jgi:hypothetical protein
MTEAISYEVNFSCNRRHYAVYISERLGFGALCEVKKIYFNVIIVRIVEADKTNPITAQY